MAFSSLVFLCIARAQSPLLPGLSGTLIGNVASSDIIINVVPDLLSGIVSAYIFYIFVDFLPRARQEQKIKNVLNSLIASVLDAYKSNRIFGHETAISHVDQGVLNIEWLDSQIDLLKEGKSDFLRLKFAMQTAHSRIEGFRHSLPLAVVLSPECAGDWLGIIDKIRLLAEKYDCEQPEVEILKNKIVENDAMKNYQSTLNLRFLEVAEQSKSWLQNIDQY